MAHCAPCGKRFATEQSHQQHIETSAKHKTFRCEPCNKAFPNQEALKQHLRDSPNHKSLYRCDPCQRSFASEDALEQHLQDSSVHGPSFDCTLCNRNFNSEDDLDQHIKYSSAHKPSYNCDTCKRSFTSENARDTHLRESRVHRTPARNTPLDRFFSSYPSFPYDPSLPPDVSYKNLRTNQRWQRNSPEASDGWDLYQLALHEELDLWLGSEDDLTCWHTLCRAIRIKPLPQTCGKCEQAVRGRHVNLVDLIAWGRAGGENGGAEVRIFNSVEELARYTKNSGKIFQNTLDEDVEGGVVLRHLLRRLFTSAPRRTR